MIQNDRDRFVLGIGIALALHLVVFGVLAAVGMDFTPYPENEPVFVTLPDYDAPPEPEERDDDDPPEPEPEPEPDPEPVEPDPVQVEPEAAEPEVRAPVEPDAPAPEVRSEPPAESPPAGRDAPAGAFSTDDLPWLDGATAETERPRESSDDLFAIDEPDEVTSDLPSWVVEGEFVLQPEASLDRDAQRTLESKRETVPGFDQRLAELVDAIENPTARSPSDGGDATGVPGGTDSPGSESTDLPGGGSIDWVGGGRRPVGELALPRLTAADFGGQVPARISFLVVFDVNEDGLVVPGSLILRQSSGYTQADQKVRRAVSSWRFDAAPGTRPVTAIATLHIARDQIR